jgi:fructokinase
MRFAPVCIFGEVLFDCFPDGRRVLGGAPFNVAWHLNAFGETPYLRSAVGDDPDGQLVRDAMADWGMELSGLQTDAGHPTGQVLVSLDDGEPGYRILPERAYDHIRQLHGGLRCDLLYHGTLALRGPESANALDAIKAGSPKQVFLDVNLRDPWWSREQTLALTAQADWVKLNRAELAALMGLKDAPGTADLSACAEDFLAMNGLRGLVVTLGAEGALALSNREPMARVAPAPIADPADSVGAGDAFASVLILGILRDWPLADTLERAQQFASCIVRQLGATAADPGLYEPFIDRWDLAPSWPERAAPPPTLVHPAPARRGRGRPRRV